MRVKNINSKETIQDLQDRGFYMYNGVNVGCYNKIGYWCWFGGRKRNGNESPTIMIDSESGTIYMRCPTTYFMKAIPDILLYMIKEGRIEESDIK